MLNEMINKLYNNIRTHLTSYQWHSFLSMVIGICVTDGRKSLKALSYLASSPALSRYFNGDKWPSKLIKRMQRKLVIDLMVGCIIKPKHLSINIDRWLSQLKEAQPEFSREEIGLHEKRESVWKRKLVNRMYFEED